MQAFEEECGSLTLYFNFYLPPHHEHGVEVAYSDNKEIAGPFSFFCQKKGRKLLPSTKELVFKRNGVDGGKIKFEKWLKQTCRCRTAEGSNILKISS